MKMFGDVQAVSRVDVEEKFGANLQNAWRNTLLVPPVAAALSLLFLCAHAAYHSFRCPRTDVDDAEQWVHLSHDDLDGSFVKRIRRHVENLGGRRTAALNVVRLITCLFLLASTPRAISAEKDAPRPWFQYGLCATYTYASCLAFCSLYLDPADRLARLVTRHLVFVLFVTWAVFLYRDGWPLATYTPDPADAQGGALFWVQFAALTLGAVVVPLVIPQRYIPYDTKRSWVYQDPTAERSPEQTASLLSRAFVGFLDPLVMTAARAPHVSLDELPALCDVDAMRNLAGRCLKYLDPVESKSKRHIFWILIRIFFWEHVELVFMLILMDLAYLGSPFALNKILSYLESNGAGATVRPWVWISGLFFAPLAVSLTSVRYMSVVLRMVAQLQGVMTQVIFDHALRVRLKADVGNAKGEGGKDNASASGVQSGSADVEAEDDDTPSGKAEGSNMIGKINNLVTTDLNMFEYANDLLLVTFMTPIQIVLSIVFLYTILGWSVFIGVATMLIMLAVPSAIAKSYHDVQAQKMKKSDARVQTITEIMGGAIRMVKLFGWEGKMSEAIDEKRRDELQSIWKLRMFNLLNRILNYAIPIATMAVTFATYTVIMKRKLTASHLFPAMEVFSIIEDRFSGWFYQLSLVLQAKVSVDRINDFLHNTELLDTFCKPTSALAVIVPDNGKLIGIRSTLFTWDASDDGTSAPTGADKRRFRLYIDNEVIFKPGRVNLIVGPTGSGKTSMLMALLSEMHSTPLDPTAFLSLPRENGIAYHAQESWIINDTIRNNILFGSAYEEERYRKVIRQCALERDLSLFYAGDQTEVGERGITLSGGQKARVTLARAVYSGAQTLLLDDVLAALDVHTAQWVVDKCFKGDLIQGRTVILVTHNLALASPIADFVVGLNNGKVVSQGSLSNVLEKDSELSVETAKELAEMCKAEEGLVETDSGSKLKKGQGKLIVDEEISEGHVGWSALKLLFGNTGGGINLVLFWALFIGGAFLSKVASAFERWVLGVWAKQYELHDPEDVSVPYYLALYTSYVTISFLMVIISSVVFVLGTIRASRIIHKSLVDTILNATFRWLDKTPSSRIIARCTQDIDAVDNAIVNYISSLTDMTSGAIVRFGAVILITPIFGIPGVLLIAIGVWMGQLYMKTQLAVKRERSNARSPVLGHIGAAITGLISIRAYGAQSAFRQESFRRIDRYTRASITYNNLTRWISVRAETLAAAFSTALAAYLVYGQAYDASRTGFSLTMAVLFSHVILWIVRYFNEFEVQGNSLERIQQYLDIDQEPKPVPSGVPPASWPTSGDLVVQNLSACYSTDGPEVLHNISFSVKSGERVSIVRRTGSGKSSLTLALLRCIPTQGIVHYSGLATDSLNLDDLRRHITIIPQVPELLTGTLRENIDPFSQWDDATLNDALAAAGLVSLESMKDERSRLNLDSVIASGGANISVGQRQIIALARAIVRQSKLLILDEATSAVDYKTDSVIQMSLRKEIAKDVTLLTVAHRLQTIMDYDRIMVLDAGRLVEFDKPNELLSNETGYFRSLVDASGERERLHELAARSRVNSRYSAGS